MIYLLEKGRFFKYFLSIMKLLGLSRYFGSLSQLLVFILSPNRPTQHSFGSRLHFFSTNNLNILNFSLMELKKDPPHYRRSAMFKMSLSDFVSFCMLIPSVVLQDLILL